MIYIRTLNINDDLSQYMDCVKDLNNPDIEISSTEQMRRTLATRPSNIITYVITLDEKIVATATCIFEKKIRYNKLSCHIEDVGVNQDFRNMGFGKMIVDHCIGVAKSKHCYKVKLFCSNDLEKFYVGLGFQRANAGMEIVF